MDGTHGCVRHICRGHWRGRVVPSDRGMKAAGLLKDMLFVGVQDNTQGHPGALLESPKLARGRRGWRIVLEIFWSSPGHEPATARRIHDVETKLSAEGGGSAPPPRLGGAKRGGWRDAFHPLQAEKQKHRRYMGTLT
eukprot:gene25444-biopygen6007